MASSRRNGVNENVSTYGGVGLGRDYTALTTWEAATDVNLVTSEVTEVLFVCKDQAEYDDKVQLAGATTSADYRRIIRGAYAEDLTGLPNAMVQFTITTTSFAGACFSIQESYVIIQDVSTENRIQTGANAYGFHISSGAHTDVQLVGCLAKTTHPTSGHGYFLGSTVGTSVVNCLAYDNSATGFLAGAANCFIMNCTAVNNGNGFGVSLNTAHINCLASGNTTDDFSGGSVGAGTNHNASSDATASGTGSRVSQVFEFVDAANDDYHLAAGDTGARGYGTIMSSATTNPSSGFLYDDDVDREAVVVWSIGMDSDGAFAEEAEPCECDGTPTEVATANGALGYLGVSLITEFGSGTKQGALIQQLFPDLRKRLQQQYRWEFCLRRLSYTDDDIVEDVPTWGFQYAFLLPTNMLQLWDVGEPHDNPRYRMENKYLLINQDAVDILYSVQVADPDMWSASFAEALELKLASKLAMPLLHKPELMQLYESMFENKISDAIFLNDIQSDDYSAYSSILMNARRGWSPREIPLDLD